MQRTTLRREPTRELSGDWEFATDPEDAGRAEGWHRPDAAWDDAREVSVPHAWQEEADLREYVGVGWYRRTVDIDAMEDNRRAVLYFGAADYDATVWVNGERVGRDREGYLPFRFDVTDALVAGENTVAVRVEDPEDLSEIPHGKQGAPWYTRVSGLWQRVDLVVVPETRVRDVRVTPDLSDDTVQVDVRAETPDGASSADLSADVRVRSEGVTVASRTGPVDGDGTAKATLSLDDPDYWTPDDPHLYEVAVGLDRGDDRIDAYADTFGMRSVERSGEELLLNGNPLSVRGALDQAYYPDTLYRPADLDTFEDEIRAAKEMGFNLLRKHIKPAHPRFLELADEMGMLVWEEPANPSAYTDASREAVRSQFAGLVERDFNRPSVVAWSLYNEEWGIGGRYDDEEESLWTDGEKQAFLARFFESARERDPTRLVCDNSGWAHVVTDLNDYHEYFVVPDRADAWRERLDHIVENPAENYGGYEDHGGGGPAPERTPLLVSEFGTWGLPSVDALEAHYGGEPHWYRHEFLSGPKSPAGVRDRFEASHLSDTFDSLDDVADAWQRRELRSVAESIADMRLHDGVAGYVLTELTDIEWEFNGLLDYLREEKIPADAFARANAPVAVQVRPDAHVCWDDGRVETDLAVVNDTDERIEGSLRWEALGEGGETGEVDVSVEPFERERVADAVSVDAPSVDGVREGSVSVELVGAGVDAVDEASVTVVSRDVGFGDRAVYTDHDGLREALADSDGPSVVDSPADGDVAFVTRLDDATREFVEDGGAAALLPDSEGRMAGGEEFSVVDLPEAESWNLCASFVTQTLLADVDVVPGWAFEGLYPYAYVSDPAPGDEVLAGYTEGWLANTGAVALSRPTGEGRLGTCTLRVVERYGSHPTATAVLAALADELHDES
ncbi:beta galactosidase jelly roll domain-containing protein [Halogeometricum sp. S1BR25-6]|uniref:Beta galactosidase jelly roll domain-containing protein n=1 Tax=Halogeometricum salsisoli TaxID=2950536 RepID=A0ABU2GKJ8_9EURY|nr:sugar-binding domain-containing protein [Halogeometricum sp. S1BR25-6]MDS0300814.1 beta galactosidase jelly roll domain-containing protein [Halogeometricum sp. S1BR25-6]